MYQVLIIGAVAAAAWVWHTSRQTEPEAGQPLPRPTNNTTPPLAPPLSTLPALPPGTFPSIPIPGNSPEAMALLPQIEDVLKLLKPTPKPTPIHTGNELIAMIDPKHRPIVAGDTVNVDMFRSGMAIPQNVPVVGLIWMLVLSLEVPGDTERKLLKARFVSPEFMVLGDQVIKRESIVEKL